MFEARTLYSAAVARSACPSMASDNRQYVDYDDCALLRDAFYTGTAKPNPTFRHTPDLLQSGLAAQLTREPLRRKLAWPGRRSGPSWEGQGKREFSGLRPARLWRRVSSSSRHSEGKPGHQSRTHASSIVPTGNFSAGNRVYPQICPWRYLRLYVSLDGRHELAAMGPLPGELSAAGSPMPAQAPLSIS